MKIELKGDKGNTEELSYKLENESNAIEKLKKETHKENIISILIRYW